MKINVKKIYDRTADAMIDRPREVLEFLVDINSVCELHGLSIAHEDIGGGFIIEPYKPQNMMWLFEASLNGVSYEKEEQ